MGGVHLGPKIATNEWLWLPSPQPPRHHRLTTWIFMWNIPPSCHPGLLQALAINPLSHSLAHREGFSSSSFFLPDLPTPALPKTASFTSGLLAMTAALQPAKISKALSEPRGRPSVLGKQLLVGNSGCYLCFDAEVHFNTWNVPLLFIIIIALSRAWFIKQYVSHAHVFQLASVLLLFTLARGAFNTSFLPFEKLPWHSFISFFPNRFSGSTRLYCFFGGSVLSVFLHFESQGHSKRFMWYNFEGLFNKESGLSLKTVA